MHSHHQQLLMYSIVSPLIDIVVFPDAVPVRFPTKLVAVTTPVELALFKTKVAALFTVTVVPLPIGCILSTLTMLIFFSYL